MKSVLGSKDIVELVAPHDWLTPSIAALIASIASTGTAIYTSEKGASEADKSRKAATDLAGKQAAEAKKSQQATESKTLSDQIKQVIAAKRGTATPGLSPDFLAQEIETQFPGNEDLIRRLVGSSFSTGG